MKRYSGPLLTKQGFVQVQIDIQDSKVVEFEESGDKGEDALIIPTFIDTHTHSGDSFIRCAPEGTIEEIVGPGGLKHKALNDADENVIIEGMRSFFTEAKKNGIYDVIEFREGGIEGVRSIKKAIETFDKKFNIQIFGRPTQRKYNENELKKLLSHSEGIGLSAYRDWDKNEFFKIAKEVNVKGTPFALHCSEDVREPLEGILEYDIHHLVHMIEATVDDIQRCAERNIPIVICPRSNMQFGKVPDIPMMVKNGVTLSLGTDNAMLASPDMFREMEFAYRISRLKGGVTAEDILMMATWNPRESLYPSLNLGKTRKKEDTYMVLDRKDHEPAYEVVTRMSSRDIKEIVVL
ncbi:MAG: amidohydrolase family protein [Thermoplasmatota archaeon]